MPAITSKNFTILLMELKLRFTIRSYDIPTHRTERMRYMFATGLVP